MAGVDFITAAISSEQGLHFNRGRLLSRRNIPGAVGLQVQELSWSVKDYDGSQLRPEDLSQAKRFLQRGKAVRDLQALLTSTTVSGAQPVDVLRAFTFMYWMLPVVERQRCAAASTAEPLRLADQICNKAAGKPLEGFSGCSAGAVWHGIPPSVQNTVGCWLTGQYRRWKSGRTNEYQLNIQNAVDEEFQQQQQAAFGCLQQLQQELVLLSACGEQGRALPASLAQGDDQLARAARPDASPVQRARSIPDYYKAMDVASLSHLQHDSHFTEQELELCGTVMFSPDMHPVSLPLQPGSSPGTSKQPGREPHHFVRCQILVPPADSASPKLLDIVIEMQQTLDDVSAKLMMDSENSLNSCFLEGHAGLGYLSLDMRLETACFPTMAEVTVAAKALLMAIRQVLPQTLSGAFTLLLNDHVAVVKGLDSSSPQLQQVPPQSVPIIDSAVQTEDEIAVFGDNLTTSSIYSVLLPGRFESQQLEVHTATVEPWDLGVMIKLSLPDSLRSLSGASMLIEACNGFYKSTQCQLQTVAISARHGMDQDKVPGTHSHPGSRHGNIQLDKQPTSKQQFPRNTFLPQLTDNLASYGQVAISQDQAAKGTGGVMESSLSSAMPDDIQAKPHPHGVQQKPAETSRGLQPAGMLDDSKSRICASCQDRVLQRDAKLELETLEGFGWFCSKCQQKATQRGAILLALGKKRHSGLTLARLSKRVDRYRRMHAKKQGSEQSGLLGDAVPLVSQLHWMLDGQDVRRLGIPPLVKKDPNAKSRTQIKYRLAVRAWSEHMSRQVPAGENPAPAMTEVSQRTDTELADNQSDSPASSAADSDPLYEPSLVSEEAHSQILDRLPCCVCKGLGSEGTLWACSSCSQRCHAGCIGEEEQTERFWFCKDCKEYGLTLKGVTLKVLSKAGDEGLTAAEVYQQAKKRGFQAHSFIGELSRLAHGVHGIMENGQPVVQCIGSKPARYCLAPDPDFAEPSLASGYTDSHHAGPESLKAAGPNLLPRTATALAAVRSAYISQFSEERSASPEPSLHLYLQRAAARLAAIEDARPGQSREVSGSIHTPKLPMTTAQTLPGNGPEALASHIQANNAENEPIDLASEADVDMLEACAPAEAALAAGPNDSAGAAGVMNTQISLAPPKPHSAAAAHSVLGAPASSQSLNRQQVQACSTSPLPKSSPAAATANSSKLSVEQHSGQASLGHQWYAGAESVRPGRKALRRSESADTDQPVSKRARNDAVVISDSDDDEAEVGYAQDLGHSGLQVAGLFCLRQSEVEIMSLGQVYDGPGKEHFWSPLGHHVFPLGYQAKKRVWNKSKRCTEWTLTVKLVDREACFQVSNQLGYKYRAPAQPSAYTIQQGLPAASAFGFHDIATQHALAALCADAEQASLQAAPTPSHAPQANQSLSHHSSQPLDASALQQARPRSRPTWRHPSRVHPSSLNQLPSQILNSPPGHDHARVARDMCARSDPARRKANEQSPASALQADPDPEQSGAELQPASLHGDNAQAVLGAAQAQKGHTSNNQAVLSSTLQRVRNTDAARASLDDLQTLLLTLLPVLPGTERFVGALNGWMAGMELSDDPTRQMRISGLFGDVQFLISHCPDAQAGVLQSMLETLSQGL